MAEVRCNTDNSVMTEISDTDFIPLLPGFTAYECPECDSYKTVKEA